MSKTVSFKYDSRLLPNVECNYSQQVNTWSIDTVSNFIKSIPGCSKIASLFEFEVILIKNF